MQLLRAAALQFPLSHPSVATVIPDALWQELRHSRFYGLAEGAP